MKKILELIYKEKSGNKSNLKANLTKKEIINLEKSGFIKLSKNNWQITERGKEIYLILNIDNFYRPTMFEKFQGYLNKKIMKL
jgi:predicted transcriptional regulator